MDLFSSRCALLTDSLPRVKMPPNFKKRKSTNPVNIDWINSEARKVILADLTDEASQWDEAAFQHDRQLVEPQGTHNHRGEPIFDRSPAQPLLRQDVKHGHHDEISPIDLWNSRPEYKVFALKIFRHRIYQEVRLQKYWNHLEDKRKKKEAINPPTGPRDYTFD